MLLSTILQGKAIVYDPAITGLTGGGATKLDGVVTVGVANGQVRAVRESSAIHFYRLNAGTLVEDGLDVVRPDDYATSTNERVWQRLSAVHVNDVEAAVIEDPSAIWFALGNDVSGSFAPSSTPARVGLTYIHTSGRKWFSVGTSSSADWIELVTAAGIAANSTLRSAVRAALIPPYVDRPTAEAALVDPGAVFYNNTLGIIEGTRKADVVFESGTTRTLTVADNGRVIICTNASGCTITLPVAGLGDGFNCGIISPANDSTLAIGTGGVANGEAGSKTATIPQGYAACSLLYHSSIDWIATGNVGTFA